MKLTHAPIVVSDQDEALKFYTEVLGFDKRADYQIPGNPRCSRSHLQRFAQYPAPGVTVDEFEIGSSGSKVFRVSL